MGLGAATLPTWQITPSHWEMEVDGGCGAAGWGMMPPTHYTAEVLPRRAAWCPHHTAMTLSRPWHMICVQTVSTYAAAVVPSDCFMWVTHAVRRRSGRAGERRRKDVSHVSHYGSKNMPLRRDSLSHRKSPGQSYVVPVRDTWGKLCSQLVRPLFCLPGLFPRLILLTRNVTGEI